MPRSQPYGHRRGRAQAHALAGRRARERFRDQVVVRFSLEKLTRRLGSRLHRRGHDIDHLLCARAAKRQPATVMSAVNAAPGNGGQHQRSAVTAWLGR